MPIPSLTIKCHFHFSLFFHCHAFSKQTENCLNFESFHSLFDPRLFCAVFASLVLHDSEKEKEKPSEKAANTKRQKSKKRLRKSNNNKIEAPMVEIKRASSNTSLVSNNTSHPPAVDGVTGTGGQNAKKGGKFKTYQRWVGRVLRDPPPPFKFRNSSHLHQSTNPLIKFKNKNRKCRGKKKQRTEILLSKNHL